MPLRSKNAVVLAKIESTTGVDASPSATTDAVLVENPTIDPEVGQIETSEVSGSLDGAGPIVGGIRGRISFACLLKGSGAGATAPEFGKLLRACGWAETITASAVPASPQAATAGTATSVTLGAAFSATAQAYRGMPLLLAVNPSGGATPFVADYTAGKVATLTHSFTPALDNTTTCQVAANVLYAPASSAIPSLTMDVHMDGIRYKFVGCRGNVSLSADSGGIGRLSFDFQGSFVSKTDAAVPSSPVYDSTRPPVWRGGAMLIDRVASALASFSLDAGNTVVMSGNPNAAEGFDHPIITARNLTGRMNPLEELVATRDIMAAFRAGTRQIVHGRWGTAAGNRIGITLPAAQYTRQGPSDRDGLVAVDVPFAATGRDSGAFLCFF